ncbi:ABC transporter permease [Metallumcola ferriviriculae]|uniref:Transport permease protein n=1 Tax=Metallumcola ferriviriculae TaxID=3039180 RepID=A0AAU0URQ5_9FIRM|nr:ABC transporter permease [Desulfitibacteraceae bacterium MK1]
MYTRLMSLVKKEFIQFFRDKAMVFLVLYIFMEVAICGWALFLDVNNLPVAFYDMDKSAESRELLDRFRSLDNFSVEYFVNEPGTVDELIKSGRVDMAVIIPGDYSRDLARGLTTNVQLLVDGSNSQIAATALGYASQVIRDYSQAIEIERLGVDRKALESMPVINNRINVLYDPELKFTHFNLLAMLALAALLTGVLLAAGAIVREKEAGTLEQLMVTPISSAEFVIAKILPMGIIKTVGLGVGVVIAMFLFDVPLKGSLMLFFLLSTLIFFAAMGLGVLLATYAKTLQQVLLLSFFALFPIMFLSGTMVPISSMPSALQWISFISPLRHYMEIVLGIFLKGVGMEALWIHALALAIFGLVIFWLSVRRLNKGLV